jgi:hypothetical protein
MAIKNRSLTTEVSLAWDLSEMDGSGYAERATRIPNCFLECVPVHGGYAAVIGGKPVSQVIHDMPDGAMFEAEEEFRKRHPVPDQATLAVSLGQPCRFEGFTLSGWQVSAKTASVSAWGTGTVGVLYETLQHALRMCPVEIKIVPMWQSPTAGGRSWYEVKLHWVW